MLMEIGDKEKEKIAECNIEEIISIGNDLRQANFKCTVELGPSEGKLNPDTISLSLDNNEIDGISDLDKISSNPGLTDKAIAEIKSRKENGEEIHDLEYVYDYYEEKISSPPILKVNSIIHDSCEEFGKINLIGKIEGCDITEFFKIDVPFSYPSVTAKCNIDKTKVNQEIEASCAIQSSFKDVGTFVIEQRLLKRKNKELLLIKGVKIPLDQNINCKERNEIKLDLLNKNRPSGLSYLQMGPPKPLDPGFFEFFFALLKRAEVTFPNIFYLQVEIWVNEGRRLRSLDVKKTPENAAINCVLGNSNNEAANYNCSNTKNMKGSIEENTKMLVDIESVRNISGFPEYLNTENLNNKIDYSDPENLDKIQNLYEVIIKEINGDNCTNNGQLIMYGETTSNESLNQYYRDVDIEFSLPDSSGLCSIEIKGNNVTIICENREQFKMSQIIISRSVIEDYKGNPLFILREYTTPESIECDISLNSLREGTVPDDTETPNTTELKYPNTTTPSTTEPDTTQPIDSSYSPKTSDSIEEYSNYGGSISRGKSSSKLSGGAVAAIIVCSIVVFIGIITILILKRKSIFGVKDRNTDNNNPSKAAQETSVFFVQKNNY
jgi:hypothetical protein